MPSIKQQSFCDVFFEAIDVDEHSNDSELGFVTAKHFSGTLTKARRTHQPMKIDRSELRKLISEYWVFVEKQIRQGVVDGNDLIAQQNLLDDLKTKGSKIANLLFSQQTQEAIWKAAAESDIFVIGTNLNEVPWEALFSREYGSRGSFLSDNCVIQRQLELDREICVEAERRSNSNYLLCFDPILEQEEQCARDFIDHLENLDVQLHWTSTKDALESATSEAAVIHWICEHEQQGLRLNNGVHYSHDDVDAHRFPKNCVLFMFSCGAGRFERECVGLSAGIAASSDCTVVAPSSVVAANAAVQIMLRISKLLREGQTARGNIVYLADIWTQLRNPLGGRQNADGIKPGDCYVLWFGIYGDCNAPMGDIA